MKKFTDYIMKEFNIEIKNNLYMNAMIDPPWFKKKGGTRKVRPNQGTDIGYQTMLTKEIFNLLDVDIFPLMKPQACVWMWSIDSYLHESEMYMQERGWKRHARIIWNKTNGVSPAFTIRYSHEYLTWWYRGGLPPIAKSKRGVYTTVITEPARQHSRKPNAAYDMIDSLYPDDHPKLDVFSRESRNGWVSYGNQTKMFD